MSRTGRPRKLAGTVFARKGSVFWWTRYRNHEGRITKEFTRTADRQQAERALSSGAPGCERRRKSARRPLKQESHFRRLGRLVFGESLQAAIPGREDTPRESQDRRASPTDFWQPRAV